MSQNAETPRRLSGAFPKDSAAGGKSAATVPQVVPEVEPEAICRDYWAEARACYVRGDYPDYASPDWRALPPEDPRKLAGIVCFAEMWRKYGDEIADDLNRQLNAPQEIWQRSTTEACETAFQQLLAKQHYRRKEAA